MQLREWHMPSFSFNLRLLTVITSAYDIMRKLTGAQNFSDVPRKPVHTQAAQLDAMMEAFRRMLRMHEYNQGRAPEDRLPLDAPPPEGTPGGQR